MMNLEIPLKRQEYIRLIEGGKNETEMLVVIGFGFGNVFYRNAYFESVCFGGYERHHG